MLHSFARGATAILIGFASPAFAHITAHAEFGRRGIVFRYGFHRSPWLRGSRDHRAADQRFPKASSP